MSIFRSEIPSFSLALRNGKGKMAGGHVLMTS